MSGIAGMIDLTGRRPIPVARLEQMIQAMAHRGPDGQRIWDEPGFGLAFRPLHLGRPAERCPSPSDTKQDALVVIDGTLHNSDAILTKLRARGHHPPVNSDEQLLLGLWAEEAERCFNSLEGQFALALWDRPQRRLILARDRFGICPLHWVQNDGWLLFASEIKGLLASAMVEARADLHGICQVFTFFGLPGPTTCFQGVSAIIPGRFLEVRRGPGEDRATVHHRTYWQPEFPERTRQKPTGNDVSDLVDQYECLMLDSLRRRLAADSPVATYSSGGLDSSLLLSMAHHLQGQTPPTLTFRIEDSRRQESAGADVLARHLGHRTNVLDLTGSDLVHAFPPLVEAAESPVVDVSAAALFRLAEAAHQGGHRAVICGEGADEWQAGYPWFRIFKRLRWIDFLPGARLDRLGYWFFARRTGSRQLPLSTVAASEAACGGPNAWLLAYNLMTTTQYHFFSPMLRASLADYSPYDDLQLPLDRLGRWDTLNRSIYLGARVHLAGLHCHARGDRSTMHASVQARYPFLDEPLVNFLAGLPTDCKMRGMTDKYLQRKLCARWLPQELTAGRKRLLHSPLEAFHQATPPPFVEQLLSDESLRATGYFDPAGVRRARQRLPHMRHGFARLFIAMGLVGVLSTQLWHHWYLQPDLADLPGPDREASQRLSTATRLAHCRP
ncbi:MAG: asparagine synthase (glutamine-hydrolyzing) [Pirellulaceae bacterium]